MWMDGWMREGVWREKWKEVIRIKEKDLIFIKDKGQMFIIYIIFDDSNLKKL